MPTKPVQPTVPVFSSNLTWFSEYCSQELVISKSKKIIKKGTSGFSNSNALGSIPNLPSFKFKLQAKANNFSMVGLAPKENFPTVTACYTSCGWYLYCFSGNLYSQDGEKGMNQNSYVVPGSIRQNSIIEVLYDQQNKTISFSIDGKHKGVAFKNVEGKELYPAVCVYDKGTTIEIST